MSTKISKSKEMKDLLEKEKKLHKEIRTDFKKISSKITEDIEFVKKSKLIK